MRWWTPTTSNSTTSHHLTHHLKNPAGSVPILLLTSVNGNKLNDIFDIFGLKQLIVDPTRTTPYSSTLIDLCFTNAPSKIVNSGIIELSISDHVLVYMTHKVHYKQTGSRLVQIRSMKNFNTENYLRDLEQQAWVSFYSFVLSNYVTVFEILNHYFVNIYTIPCKFI
jgi:hypothetical protein